MPKGQTRIEAPPRRPAEAGRNRGIPASPCGLSRERSSVTVIGVKDLKLNLAASMAPSYVPKP
ncbi:hypothetical protein [Allomeiothermus silvanus]|uniref:hypothetical protein n=1 Tax=Allomeiothermus silvanus TaxID=52022 RepID=UPI0023F03822|nr:hypothetical protein [Allomeiothermus silvanus]